jgi:DNA-binding FadR family transcriptional regulator
MKQAAPAETIHEISTPAVRKRNLHVPKASEIVAEHIRRQIVRKDLAEGDFLPPESKLMAEFGVSRPTIREAYRILETERLVSVARGARGGAVVHEPDSELIAQYFLMVLQAERTTIDEIYLARNFFEPSVVRSLASRATRAECQPLRNCLAEEYASLHDAKAFASTLANFHKTLVELSGNRPLILLVNAINEVVERHQIMVVTQRRAGAEAGVLAVAARGLKSHKKLIDLIENREPDAAAAHWREHMELAFKTWVTGFEGMTILELYPD